MSAPTRTRAPAAATGALPAALGRRLVLTGAVLAALAVLATLVFVAAWAVGGSARLAERARGPLPPASVLELTDDVAPSVAPGAARPTGVVIVTDAGGALRIVPGRIGAGGA